MEGFWWTKAGYEINSPHSFVQVRCCVVIELLGLRDERSSCEIVQPKFWKINSDIKEFVDLWGYNGSHSSSFVREIYILQFFLSRTRTSGGKRERIAETSNLIQYKYLFLYNIWVSWTQWISNNNDKISAITRWQEEGLKSRPISANGTVIWSHKPYNRHCTHVVNLGWWVTIIHCIKTKAWIKHDETPVDHGFAKENTSWYTCSHICEQIIASISNKSRNMAR